MKKFTWVFAGAVTAAALGVLLGPLRAQETGAQQPEPAPEPAADSAPAPDEGLSADNSLSFPVDI